MVPNGWEHKAFGEVVKLSKSKYDPKKSTDCFPCIELEHIVQETGQLTGNVPASNLGSTKNKFKAGDVIFGKLRPYLRKFAQPNFDGVCSSEIWVFSPTKKIINPYLFQLVQTNQFISEANKSAGSKMPRADWGVVSEMIFPLPPLPEQRKIAKILSTWDKAISTTERLIDNSKQQKKALMQQLLTGKKRLLDDSGKPFEGEWEEVVLRDLCNKVIDNRGKTPPLSKIGLPLVEINSIVNSKYPKLSKVTKFVSPETFKTWFRNGHPERGDILVATVGSAGISALVNLDEGFGSIAQNLIAIRPNSKADSSFLYYLMNTPHYFSLVRAVVMGAVQPSLKVPHLLSFKMKIPSISEQQKIASVLSNADKEIELLERQLADLKQEKKALMQQLLTGKRRVKLDDKEVA